MDSASVLSLIPTHADFTATSAAAAAAAATDDGVAERAYTALSDVINLTPLRSRITIIPGLLVPVRTYQPRPTSVTIAEAVPASVVAILEGKGYTVVTNGARCVVSGW